MLKNSVILLIGLFLLIGCETLSTEKSSNTADITLADQALKDRSWDILQHRSQGKTLEQSGKPFGITRERVRQIEAKFQRKVCEKYWSQTEANLSRICGLLNLVKPSLDSEMHEMFPLADDNR